MNLFLGPTIYAFWRRKQSRGAIAAINVLIVVAGGGFPGLLLWLWALKGKVQRPKLSHPSTESVTMQFSQSSHSEIGMPTIGYVAMTVGVLGAIATLSVYATPGAIILALPAVILCTKAHRIYKSRFQKASGTLVVSLVLNWIGTFVSGLCILLIFYLSLSQNRQATARPISNYADQNEVSGVQGNTATPPFRAPLEKILARALNASATELGPADVSQVELLTKQISEMASAEGQLAKTWGTCRIGGCV
jgi:hypothetical protein